MVVARGCSSVSIMTCLAARLTSTGTISSLNLPAAMAAAARSWLRRANSSWTSRGDLVLLGQVLGGDAHVVAC